LDGDEAGQKRTREILELFVSEQMDLRILTLPDGLDPCDYLLKHSGTQLKSLLSTAVDALEHKIRILCQGFDPLIDTHRANSALEDILETMSRVTRDTLVTSESSRLRHDQLLARLSRQFGVEQSEIRMRIDSIRQKASERAKQRQEFRQMQAAPPLSLATAADKQNAAPVMPPATQNIVYKYSELNAIECELFEVMALFEDVVPMAIERFPVTTLSSTTAKKIFQVYLDLELAGHTLDFESVLSAVEDAGIKNVLVSIEEQASRKAVLAKMTPDERLHSLCERLSGQEDRAYRRQQINLLEKKQVDAETELDLLNQIVLQNRLKHGLVQTDNP
jgi:DNA primase